MFSSTRSLLYLSPLTLPFSGSLFIPGSKSYAIRVLALALLNFGRRTVLYNYGACDDVTSAIRVIRVLGARVEVFPERLEVLAPSREVFFGNRFEVLDVGESGLCGRMFGIIAALTDNSFCLRRRGSLCSRSFGDFAEIFSQLGVDFWEEGGELIIRGPLRFGPMVSVDCSRSSQFLTGLLFACVAGDFVGECRIIARDLVSVPYVELSLALLAEFGFRVVSDTLFSQSCFICEGAGVSFFQDYCCYCEGDWSLASNFIVAGVLAASTEFPLRLGNLQKASLQADRRILDILEDLGARFIWEGDCLLVSQTRLASGGPYVCDLRDCPDLYPILSLLVTATDFPWSFIGLERLGDKESDRRVGFLQGDLADHRVLFARFIATVLGLSKENFYLNSTAFTKSSAIFLYLLSRLGSFPTIPHY